jgi:anthranilate synthase component II
MKVLILDNYDSFTFNLAQMVGTAGAQPVVRRNDALGLDDVRDLAPGRIIISPGPGRPDSGNWFGICSQVIRELGASIPILGVCLGHQGIAHTAGGRIVNAPQVMHGKTSEIRHDGHGIFRSLPSPLTVMRYHSLIVERDSLPASLQITAETDDGVIMGLRHRDRPLEGVQFHPESIGTETGQQMIRSFLGA